MKFLSNSLLGDLHFNFLIKNNFFLKNERKFPLELDQNSIKLNENSLEFKKLLPLKMEEKFIEYFVLTQVYGLSNMKVLNYSYIPTKFGF